MVKKGLIVGLVNLLLGFGINWAVGAFFPAIAAQYQNSAMFRPWSDPLMMIYFAYPFILGIALAYVWKKLGKMKPIEFATFYFIAATIPGMFITYTSFQVSLAMVLLWAATGFVQVWVAGYVFTKVK